MNVSSFHPLMSPHLQPSPFSPAQFLACTPRSPAPALAPVPPPAVSAECRPDAHAECSDEDMASPPPLIKKRPLEVTEDLVEGRIETASQRLRRCASHRAALAGCDPPRLVVPTIGVEPITPPNRPRSPPSFFACDMTLTPASDCLTHSAQPRRTPKNRRSTKVKRACAAASKSSPRESSPALVRSRSPLGRWTPPAVSAFQLFSVQPDGLPTTPPRRSPMPAYAFDSQSHVWTNHIPWTIASPSSSPYPSHSSPPHSHHQA